MFRNMDFVLNNTFCFNDRFGAEPDTFSGDGESYKVDAVTVWDTNFVPNVRTIPLHLRRNRGAGGSFLQIELAENAMTAHISEFPVGTYKKAHRHGAGAHVVIIGGEGYSLMWPEGEEPRRYEWQVGTMVVPPNRWFHQHFNTGTTPSRYLAFKHESVAIRNPQGVPKAWISRRLGGDQIDYADESATVRSWFRDALAKNGLAPHMDEAYQAELVELPPKAA
jgi:hypothetical protein